MKKLIYGGLFFVITGSMVISCKKKIIETSTQTNLKNELNHLDQNIPLISNPYPETDYLVNVDDADDEKINKQLFEIGLIIRKLLTDNRYNEIIIEEAKNHDNNCISIEKFIIAANPLKLDEHIPIFNKLRQLIENADLTHRSTNPEKIGEVENYIPSIFVVNANIADYSKKPIISAGTYVNSSLPGLEKYDEYIVAWYPNINGGFTEFLISEKTAMTTTHPIFIVDNAEESITLRDRSDIDYLEPEQLKNQETSWYASKEYQINHRYESFGKSEFCITGAHITEDGSVWLICKRDNGTYNTWKEISKVHKNNIGVLLNHWEQFCNNNVTPLNSNYIFWNTYERDWAKSNKDLGQATRNGKTIYLYGRRKYSNDWYAYHPSQLNNNPVDLNTIYWSWAKWHNNSKGKFRIWRIQP